MEGKKQKQTNNYAPLDAAEAGIIHGDSNSHNLELNWRNNGMSVKMMKQYDGSHQIAEDFDQRVLHLAQEQKVMISG